MTDSHQAGGGFGASPALGRGGGFSNYFCGLYIRHLELLKVGYHKELDSVGP